MNKEKLYEATYVVYDGDHEYLIKDRYWASSWNDAFDQFAEEMNECYGADLDANPLQRKQETHDWRELEPLKLECILDVGRLTRACQFALRYIDNLPTPPMWMRDPAREALRRELIRATER